jgi:ATP-binding cassette subfamily F protein 3
MISVNNLTIRFGNFELFKNVGFMINPRDRIGLVGKNGAGKTTLLKVIEGMQAPSEGVVQIPPGVRTGYLAQQFLALEKGRTVIEETREAFAEIRTLEKNIAALNIAITERTDYESVEYNKLLTELSESTERYTLLEGDSIEANMMRTLKGLGFSEADMQRKTNEFSGGWRMRIELAKLLLQRPEVLLLDEPTNHLDIISIQWLEEFLRMYQGAVVLISHDRTFLDQVTERTLEISMGKIYDYKVAYSHFITLRKERITQQLAAYENQQKMIAETERFIERFRYKATKSNQVQSRVKALDKLERIEVDEMDVRNVHFRFPDAPRSGSVVVETLNCSKAYGKLKVLTDVDFILERGEKIALVGKNGEGKTTFSRIINGELDYTGTLKLGGNVNIGYYAQNQDELLDENLTVLETLDKVAVGDIRNRLRDILGAFLFGGEDVDKKVKVLSGGERSRLSLAKLMLEPYNLLILDEPTNHLDIASKDVLKEALKQYNGTLVLVSHDRYFLDGLVDKVYEVIDHRVREEVGGINAYLKRYHDIIVKSLSQNTAPKPTEKKSVPNKEQYEARKEFEREVRKLKRKVENYESEIERIEKKLAKMNEQMQDIDMHTPEFYNKYNWYKNKLSEAMSEWERLAHELDALESQRPQDN